MMYHTAMKLRNWAVLVKKSNGGLPSMSWDRIPPGYVYKILMTNRDKGFVLWRDFFPEINHSILSTWLDVASSFIPMRVLLTAWHMIMQWGTHNWGKIGIVDNCCTKSMMSRGFQVSTQHKQMLCQWVSSIKACVCSRTTCFSGYWQHRQDL